MSSKGSGASSTDESPSSLHEGGAEDGSAPQEIQQTVSRLSRVMSGKAANYEEVDLPMGLGKEIPGPMPDREPYKVGFTGPDDPLNPLNWSLRRKMQVSGVMIYASLVLSFGSGVFAPALIHVERQFHVGNTVAALGISLYVLGFSAGPTIWGPLSELYGRKPPLLVSYFLFTCFVFASSTAKDLQTLLICRFFSGAVGSAPFSVVAASLADLYTTETRGIAMSIFSLMLVCGPMISPIVGAYISASYLSWRWTLYLTGIMSSLAFFLLLFFQDETYHPSILKWKAKELRRRTNNWAIYAEIETKELDFEEIVNRNLTRPIRMLFTEPILFLIALYNGFVYGLLYMSLEAIPIIFIGFGFKGGNIMLPYLSLFVGCLASNTLNLVYFEPRFNKKLKASGKRFLPEERLPFMMMGSVFFSIGIFWLCWSGAYPKHVHWIVPCIGMGFYGFGFIALFIPVYNYLIDTYLIYAASALSGSAFIRGGMGCAFPLFSSIMFHNLGIQWAGTLIGCISLLLLPVPFLFYKYGPWLRSKSNFANFGQFMQAPPPKTAATPGVAEKKEV